MDMIECRFDEFDFVLDELNCFYDLATFVNEIKWMWMQCCREQFIKLVSSIFLLFDL